MMLVSVVVKESSLHGKGIFSLEEISAGAVVWRFSKNVDKVFSKEDYLKLSFEEKRLIDIYGYYAEDEGGYVLCGDDARFTNHSLTPNIKKVSPIETIAIRDIAAGEEITENYYDFDACAAKKLS